MKQTNLYSGERIISRILIDKDFGPLTEELSRHHKVFAVMDSSVAMNCPASHILADLFSQRGIPGMLIEISEQTKSMDTVLEVCNWLLEQGADRDAIVLAIGGGITSDIVGFAAAIYKRGVRVAYIPTTLLAQVDAAIGGKTGVNLHNYKNIIGIIRQPEFTYLCPRMLESLPRRDFLSGAAELLKTFIIEDRGSYALAVEWLRGYSRCQTAPECADYVASNSEVLEKLIFTAAEIKADIVSRDQFERGERRKLNLGHTFAHAIETLARRKGNDITHGEAVSMGILLAAELADVYRRSVLGESVDEPLARRFDEDFLSCDLPIGCPFRITAMTEIMKKDKKAAGSQIHFILPFAIGDVRDVELTVEKVCELLSC